MVPFTLGGGNDIFDNMPNIITDSIPDNMQDVEIRAFRNNSAGDDLHKFWVNKLKSIDDFMQIRIFKKNGEFAVKKQVWEWSLT